MRYIPDYRKSRRTLARAEGDLRRLIARESPFEKLTVAAERVRESRIRALRASKANLPPAEGRADSANLARIDGKVERLLRMSSEEILAEFGYEGTP